MADAGTAEFGVVAESWFDGERQHGEPATFVLQDGRVLEVTTADHGAALAQRGLAVERGGLLMPGLVDGHVHLILDGALTNPNVRAAHLKEPLELRGAAARTGALGPAIMSGRAPRAWTADNEQIA